MTDKLIQKIKEYRFIHLSRRFYSTLLDTVIILSVHKFLAFSVFNKIINTTDINSEAFLSNITLSFSLNAFSLPVLIFTYHFIGYRFFENTLGMKLFNLKVINKKDNLNKVSNLNYTFRSLTSLIYLGPMIFLNVYSSLNGMKLTNAISEVLDSYTYLSFFFVTTLFFIGSIFLSVLRKDQMTLADLSSNTMVSDQKILSEVIKEYEKETNSNIKTLKKSHVDKDQSKAA